MSARLSLFPEAASTLASQVDGVTWGLLAFSGLTLSIVFGLLLLFSILYHESSGRNRKIRPGNQGVVLEVAWTAVTLACFLGLFVWAARIYLAMHEAPPGATEIHVMAKQWMWDFQHANGLRELGELHVPVGQPIVLTMTSEDVIHSFFVPDFRIKQDVLPGRYVQTWFQATRPGEYHLFCTQYCGTLHAGMGGRIVVMKPEDYQAWLQSGLSPRTQSLAGRGQKLFTRMGCISCNLTPGPGRLAPNLAGIYGNMAALSDGTSARVDDNYIRESILNPRAKIVMGYQPIMPSFAGQVNESELQDLIAYIKTLREPSNHD